MRTTLRTESVRSFSVIAPRSLALLMLPAVSELRSATIQRRRKQKSLRFDSAKRLKNRAQAGQPSGHPLTEKPQSASNSVPEDRSRQHLRGKRRNSHEQQ